MKSIQQQLAEARIDIENALAHPEIQQQLALVGYNKKKLLEGKALYDHAVDLQQAYEGKYGQQYGATDTFYQNLEEVQTLYSRHRKLAKIAYENNRQQLNVLQLNTPLPSRIETWLSHALTFYKGLLLDSEVIEQYGVLEEDLLQTQAMAEALLDARNRQISAKGEAQRATQQRNKSLMALYAWMKDFRQAARFALREDAQLLEVLGMAVTASR